MYGCAINEIEAYHLQFMKRTLGVKVTTNSCVVYAETGRLPLHVDLNLCMIKYRINTLNSDVKKIITSETIQCFNIQKSTIGLSTSKTSAG